MLRSFALAFLLQFSTTTTTRSACTVSEYNGQKLASTVLESDMTKLLMHA